MMKNTFYLKFCILLILLCIPISYAFPQEGFVVRGKVTDELKEAIPGANVTVKGAKVGTITDYGGNYSITVPNKKAVLVFSFMGYSTQEIVVGERKVINLLMKDESQSLEEVVVIAYGTQKRGLVTSAMSSISNEELLKSPVASITNTLAGAVPGIATVQTTGQPGRDEAEIYIRGVGSLDNSLAKPLILVDGVEREFSQIDPNEIENISILKDASATAVFGVRGANGVILVTTRRGKEGKAKISVSTSLGLQQPISLVEQTGSYEYANFWNTKQQLDGVTTKKSYFTPEQIEAYRTGSDPIMYPNIDWGEYLFKNVFLQSKNNVNISGGSKNVKYFISVSYLYQNGVLKDMPGQMYSNNYRYDRYNYRANIDAKLTATTSMKLGLGGYLGKTREPRTNSDLYNGWVMAQIWSLPFAGPGFVNNVRTVIPKGVTPNNEMRDGLVSFYGQGYTQNYKTTLNMDVDITQRLDFVTPGLSISLKGAYDNRLELTKIRKNGTVADQYVRYKSFYDSEGTMDENDPNYDKTYVFTPRYGDSPLTYESEGKGRDQNWYIEGRINYDRSFDNHKVGGLFLYNQSRDYYPVYANNAAMPYQYIPRSYVGLVGRVTYSYLSKYLLDLNVGYNGSENFAPGKRRFGLFPSVSAGWVLTGEKFMEQQKFVDFLKFRVAWGRVGNDLASNSRFMYIPSTWSQSGSYSFGVKNPVSSEAFAISTLGNPEVTWETADKQNYGIESKFFGNRLSFNFDYFIEHRKGILTAPQSNPNITALSLPNMNLGKVNNHGYEIELGWNDKIGKNFSYRINANVSYARNEIVFKDEVPNQYDYMNETGGATGRTKDLYKYIRLYQYDDFIEGEGGKLTLNPSLPQPASAVYPGDAMYADLNGDNIVDGKDRFITGYSNRPEYVFGLNMGCEWKGISFSMQWLGATHVDKLYEIEYRIPFTNSGHRGLLTYFYEGCWTPENQLGAKYPRAAETSESWNSAPSTLWLQDASYIRLKNLTVGYTIKNKDFLKKLGISSLGITFSGYNLLTFSPMKYIDPESITNNNGKYPLVKLYNFGLNLNF